MPRRSSILIGFAVALGVVLGATASPAVGQAPGYDGALERGVGGPARALKDGTLSTALVALADAAERAEAAGGRLPSIEALPPGLRASIAAGELRLDGEGAVQVFVEGDDTGLIAAALAARGARIERTSAKYGMVQARVPAAQLREVAALPSVGRVRSPDYPVLRAGTVTSEGDALISADEVRSTIGANGSGITVGVISDGVEGLAASQSSGELPNVDTTTCNVVAESPTSAGAGAEGTALLEIVHDVAPGAALLFGHFGFGFDGTGLDFNAAVDCLAANADIVVDDIGFFGAGAYDGSSFVSENTADALNGTGPIRGYYTAVGNDARRHYQGDFVDSGFDIVDGPETWDAHSFDVSAGTKGTKNALGTTPRDFNRFVLSPGGVATIVLVWDDTWGTSGNDYDLFVGDGTTISPCSLNQQNGNDAPLEVCSVENTDAEQATADIFIGNFEGSAQPRDLDLFLLCSGCVAHGNGNLLDFTTPGSSVSNQADAGGFPASVVSAGAVRHSTPSTIEAFSSLGLTEDGRLKPDLVGPDGVCVTGSGGFQSGNPSCQTKGRSFFGTSAAAPHVAAVAALLLDCAPGLDRVSLRDRLLDGAVDLGAAGPDNVYGLGRIDALASATAAGCEPAPVGGIAELPEVAPAPVGASEGGAGVWPGAGTGLAAVAVAVAVAAGLGALRLRRRRSR